MPSTAIAAAKNKWKRIKHKYKVHTPEYYAKKLARQIGKEKQIAINKSMRKH